MSAPATAWFLLTVVGNTVSPSHGFVDRHLCEEGKSLFLYGQSIEDKAANDKLAAEVAEKDRIAFETKYKPRPPKTVAEKKAVAQVKGASTIYAWEAFDASGRSILATCGTGLYASVYWEAEPDGLMHPMQSECSTGIITVGTAKQAYCVPDDGGKP